MSDARFDALEKKVDTLLLGQERLQRGHDELRAGQDELRAGHDELRAGQEALRKDVGDLKTGQDEIRHHLICVDDRFDKIDRRFDKVEGRLDRLEVGQEELVERVKQIAEGHGAILVAIAKEGERTRAYIGARIQPLEDAVRLHFGTLNGPG